MNVDGYIRHNEESWQRLGELAAAARRPGALAPGEATEFVSRYRTASAQLAYAQTHLGDPTLDARLTGLVANAHSVLYGRRTRLVDAVREFVTVGFPGAVWYYRRQVAASAALLLIPALVFGIWFANSDAALDAAIEIKPVLTIDDLQKGFPD